MKMVQVTCSNKPRPRVQHGAKGHAGWNRDVFHVQRIDAVTLCGVDCSEWLHMDPKTDAECIGNPDCCARCAAILQGF